MQKVQIDEAALLAAAATRVDLRVDASSTSAPSVYSCSATHRSTREARKVSFLATHTEREHVAAGSCLVDYRRSALALRRRHMQMGR